MGHKPNKDQLRAKKKAERQKQARQREHEMNRKIKVVRERLYMVGSGEIGYKELLASALRKLASDRPEDAHFREARNSNAALRKIQKVTQEMARQSAGLLPPSIRSEGDFALSSRMYLAQAHGGVRTIWFPDELLQAFDWSHKTAMQKALEYASNFGNEGDDVIDPPEWIVYHLTHALASGMLHVVLLGRTEGDGAPQAYLVTDKEWLHVDLTKWLNTLMLWKTATQMDETAVSIAIELLIADTEELDPGISDGDLASVVLTKIDAVSTTIAQEFHRMQACAAEVTSAEALDRQVLIEQHARQTQAHLVAHEKLTDKYNQAMADLSHARHELKLSKRQESTASVGPKPAPDGLAARMSLLFEQPS